jgi:hypothetical protein
VVSFKTPTIGHYNIVFQLIVINSTLPNKKSISAQTYQWFVAKINAELVMVYAIISNPTFRL